MNSSNSYICKKKDLAKLINKIEKRKVSDFNELELEKVIKQIALDLGRKY